MKKYITTLLVLTAVHIGYAQSPDVTNTPTPPNADTEALKKKTGAPNRADFSNDDAYNKAKTDWVAKNKAAYDKLNKVDQSPATNQPRKPEEE